MHRPLVALIACFAAVTDNAVSQGDSTVYYFNPDWSPDGTEIVFESGVDGRLSIYAVDVDGNHLTRLTDGRYNDEGPVWSPDGEKIAFFSNRREGREERPVSLQIYVMNADGTEQRRVTDEGSALDHNVSWAPDGGRIVFQSRPDTNPGVHSLYVIGIDGVGRKRITDGQYDDTSPAWSPDGNLIVFTQAVASYKFFGDPTREGREVLRRSAEIAVLDLDDGTRTLVTHNDAPDTDPSWNADGSEMFFFRNSGQKKVLLRQTLGQTDPVVAVADGDAVSNTGAVTRTRVSPNGRFLTYTKQVEGEYGLYVFDLQTERETRLVGGFGSISGTP